MTDIDFESRVRDLAVCAAMKQVIERRERELKADIATLRRGTIYAYDGDHELGYVSVPKPSQPSPRIEDEAAAVGWAVEQFGEGAMCVRLSDTGRRDVIEAAKKGTEVPGVEIPEPRPATPRFTPAKDVRERIAVMVAEGRLTAADLPALEVPCG